MRRGAASCWTVAVLFAAVWVPVPAVATASPVPRSLAAVTCPTATRCFAVGYAEARPSYKARTLVERWNGSSWSIMSSPNGSLPNTFLAGIACTSANSCMAVGHTRVNYYGGKSFALRMTANTWSAVAIPGDPGGRLVAVACTGATNCFAVGEYVSRIPQPLAMHWNGAQWTKVGAALPPGLKTGYLFGVACSSERCFAVGGTDDGRNPNVAVIERWDGTRFVIDSTFRPSGGVLPAFRSVTCPTSTRCLAVGDDGAAKVQTLAAVWSGKTWSIESTKNRDAVNFLLGASCWTASACLAVGLSAAPHNTDPAHTLSELRSGSTWSIIPSPNKDPRSSELSGVGCTGRTRCYAVGTSTQPATPIILQWDGARWNNVNPPS